MKRIIASALVVLIAASAFAQRPSPKESPYQKKTFTSSEGTELLYRQLDPQNMNPKKKYPVILFLHGAGERGNDNERQLVHGSRMFLNPTVLEQYPAYVLFPQCPEGKSWSYDPTPGWDKKPGEMPADRPESSMIKALYELIQYFKENYNVNESKIYVMGLSMGGMATYEICVRHPELFAAAVPICGNINPSRLAAAKDVKFSIYHGDSDPVVPVEGSREAYKALKAAGAKVRYKEFVGCDHGSWNPAFNEPDFFSWLFKQKK